MTTTINLPLEVREQRFVLPHVSWATYESLLADYSDTSTPRFTESVLSEFLEQSKTLSTLNWRRMVRTWARQ